MGICDTVLLEALTGAILKDALLAHADAGSSPECFLVWFEDSHSQLSSKRHLLQREVC